MQELVPELLEDHMRNNPVDFWEAMTADTIHDELTAEEAATLDRALQRCPEAQSQEFQALQQKLGEFTEQVATDPLERVRTAVDAVDERMAQQMQQRRQTILEALDAGYTQQAVADYLGLSQTRIAQMLKSGK